MRRANRLGGLVAISAIACGSAHGFSFAPRASGFRATGALPALASGAQASELHELARRALARIDGEVAIPACAATRR